MLIDWPQEFGTWLDRLEARAAGGDTRSAVVYRYVLAELAELQALPAPPGEETAALRRVRQSGRYPLWRLSHRYHAGVAVRLICWFPPDSDTVVVAVLGADKAWMGDVFYNSVGARADVLIDQWLRETEEER